MFLNPFFVTKLGTHLGFNTAQQPDQAKTKQLK